MVGQREPSRLNDDARIFVVQALACFDTPSTTAAAVKREFGIAISPQAVEAYDPTKRAGRNLAQKWRSIFDETRRAFLAETARIGVANQAVRLRLIGRVAERAEAMGNFALVLQALEQAAKEVGNSYSNRREISGADGAPLMAAATIDRPPAETREQWLERKARERAALAADHVG